MTTLYTLGYAHWTASALAAKVQELDAILLDIRYSNYSRRAEFNSTALEQRLGSAYYHMSSWGNANYRSGGIRIHRFRDGLILLRSWEDLGRPFILMCGCADYATCHRAVLADMLRDAGYQVEELESGGGDRVALRAISLWQPWASLVAWSEKRYETRDWSTSYRGPLAIHATKAFPNEAREACVFEPSFVSTLVAHGVKKLDDLPRGAIVAVCDLVSCQRTDWRWTAPDFSSPLSDGAPNERRFGDFSSGRYAWKLANVRSLPAPVPCRGAMGLWTPDSEIVAAVQSALHNRRSTEGE